MALLSLHTLHQVTLSGELLPRPETPAVLSLPASSRYSRIHCKWFQVFPQVSSCAALRKGWQGGVWSLFSVYHIYCIYSHSSGACPEHFFLFHSNYTCSHRPAFSHISGYASSIFITTMSVTLTCTFKVQFYLKNTIILSSHTWHWLATIYFFFKEWHFLSVTVQICADISIFFLPRLIFIHTPLQNRRQTNLSFFVFLSSLLGTYQCWLTASAEIIDGVLIPFKFPSFK